MLIDASDPLNASAPHPGRDHRALPLRIGTRASPLAQTHAFMNMLTGFCPLLRAWTRFRSRRSKPRAIRWLTDGGRYRWQGSVRKRDSRGPLDRRIDFAVHSLKDMETTLPNGVVLACTIKREDEDSEARAVSTAERSMLHVLDGSCGP